MPFSQASLDFLMENRINDSRVWFNEHKSDYIDLVRDPMRQLVADLAPTFAEIDPLLVCDPLRSVSRIYRDARYARGKSIFHETLWCSFSRDKHQFGLIPGYFFEISPVGFQYGCGCYMASADFMAEMRRLILAGDAGFNQVLQAYDGGIYTLMDSKYKRSRHPDAPQWQKEWLDQRSPCLIADSGDLDLLFSDGLAQRLGADYMAIKPFYDFLLRVSQSIR